MRFSVKVFLLIVLVVFALVISLNKSEDTAFSEVGTASYYAWSLDGNRTASGEIYRHDGLTAAHRTLPLGTWLKVENLTNKKTVIVKVNDRGPFVEDRILDLSRAAFTELSEMKEGLIKVRITEIEVE
ncbi:septal ring lytic transglycosylase RlpA family protein [Marinilabilia sp.]|uniref:septal ring lytic transglycosylase RlpA family protein n=1 Tax=Marinilabilia sp. TaxID=2021252 RepID=UPI0025B7EC91|nr:septal ring lytic transglycosylase RlpA family protein [Marinilabilia sp.]